MNKLWQDAIKNNKVEERKSRVIELKIRGKYTVSDELAILRQRDTKPEEFAEYNAFVEQIKADVKAESEAHIAKYEKMFGALPTQKNTEVSV